MAAATTNEKVDNVKANDQVKAGDGSSAGETARSEAVNSFKPIEAGSATAVNPVTDGKMGMAPGDETTKKYFDSAKVGDGKSGETGAIQPTDFTPPAGDASDKKGDRLKDGSKEPLGDVAREYSETLKRAGLTDKQAEEFTRSTLDRLRTTDKANDNAIKGTPEEQMARMNKAMTEILDGTGKRPDGRLENGQVDHLKPQDRKNLVADLAAREADPAKFVNQGEHMTCVLQSGQKQRLEGGDPAKVAEQIASVANRGYADIQEGNDGKTRRVNVDSRSFAPDKESGQPFSTEYHGDAGKRGMAGHVYDALAGQTVADLRAEREGRPTSQNGIDNASYVYMAANADQVGANRNQTRTNEALMQRDANGDLKFKANSPDADIWQTAHLNKAMGGEPGSVFAHRSVVGDGRPPKGMGYPEDLKISSFSDSAELSQKLKAFESATGKSAQLLVNSPFLPGGGENGHGLHAMNAKAGADGSFKLDNNWAGQFDLGNVSAAAMDKATNKEKWQIKGQGQGGHDGKADPVPDDRTVIKPGSGRNPNETPTDFNQRLLDEQKMRDEKLKEEQLKEEQAREKEKEKNPLDGKDKSAADVNARYNAAMAAFKEMQKVNPLAKPPAYDDFK